VLQAGPKAVRGDRHPPLLGQPGGQLGQRPGPRPGPGVRVEARRDRRQVGGGQPRRPTGAGTVGQPGEALDREPGHELAHRLLVDAQGAGGLRDRRAAGDGFGHFQALVRPPLDGAAPQPARQLGALGRGQVQPDDLRHRGASFTPLSYDELPQGCLEAYQTDRLSGRRRSVRGRSN
jgi:hypothetical protein